MKYGSRMFPELTKNVFILMFLYKILANLYIKHGGYILMDKILVRSTNKITFSFSVSAQK